MIFEGQALINAFVPGEAAYYHLFFEEGTINRQIPVNVDNSEPELMPPIWVQSNSWYHVTIQVENVKPARHIVAVLAWKHPLFFERIE